MPSVGRWVSKSATAAAIASSLIAAPTPACLSKVAIGAPIAAAASDVKAPEAPPTDAKKLLDKVQARYAKIDGIHARFHQELTSATLGQTDVADGECWFAKPGKMRWDYTQPDKVYYISDGDVLWSYEVANKQAIKMNVKDSELYDSLKFLFGEGDLRASFDVKLGAEKDGLRALVLTPKSGQKNYKTLTLWAKPGTWEIARTELVDPLDNVSVITFTGASYTKLKPEAFQFKPPAGATVQDLTQKGSAPEAPAP